MKTFRAAIVGCGGIAKVHESVLRDLKNVEVAACVDIRPERAWEMARRFGCPAYQDLGKMLRAEAPDTVHLCTPHWLHVPQALLAAEAGAAVFCEKPPAVSREQWEQMLKLSGTVPVGICFQNRYNPNVVRAREIVKDGAIGDITGVRAFLTWRRDAAYYRDDWHGRWETEGGGVLINQAIHTLDLLVSFLGRPDRVECRMANHHLSGIIEEEDTAELFLTSSGRRGLLYASTAWTRDEAVLLEITGDKGSLRLEKDDLTVTAEGRTERIPCPGGEGPGKSCWGAGHRRCIEDFYQCLENGEPYGNDPASCTDTMEALFRAYEQEGSALRQAVESFAQGQ